MKRKHKEKIRNFVKTEDFWDKIREKNVLEITYGDYSRYNYGNFQFIFQDLDNHLPRHEDDYETDEIIETFKEVMMEDFENRIDNIEITSEEVCVHRKESEMFLRNFNTMLHTTVKIYDKTPKLIYGPSGNKNLKSLLSILHELEKAIGNFDTYSEFLVKGVGIDNTDNMFFQITHQNGFVYHNSETGDQLELRRIENLLGQKYSVFVYSNVLDLTKRRLFADILPSAKELYYLKNDSQLFFTFDTTYLDKHVKKEIVNDVEYNIYGNLTKHVSFFGYNADLQIED